MPEPAPVPPAPTPELEPTVPPVPKSESENDLDLLNQELPAKDPSLEEIFPEDNKAKMEQDIPADEPSFKYPLDGKERSHYENILKANRGTIGSLRKQLQESLAKNEALQAELDAQNK